MKKNPKRLVSLFTVGFCIGIMTMQLFAGTAYSNYGTYGPINGYPYKNQSIVYVYANARGCVSVEVNQTSDAPTGYMGASSWLYKDDALFKASSWSYNAVSDHSLWSYTDLTDYYEYGYYYADGQTRAYDGSGYVTYGVFSSPIQQLQ